MKLQEQEFKKLNEDLRKIREENSLLHAKIDCMKLELENEMKIQTSALKNEMKMQKLEHENEMKIQKSALENEIKMQKLIHENEMKMQKDFYENKLTIMEEKHNADIKNLTQDMEEIRSMHQEPRVYIGQSSFPLSLPQTVVAKNLITEIDNATDHSNK